MDNIEFYPDGWEFRPRIGRSNQLVYGVAKNDSTYQVRIKVGVRNIKCPAYAAWHSMLTRCYTDTQPNYANTTCCQKWLDSFMAFRRWYISELKRAGLPPHSLQVDKDLFGIGDYYSPQDCILLPAKINAFVKLKPKGTKGLPPGIVETPNGNFQAQLGTKHHARHLGTFKTMAEASRVWLKRKLELVEKLETPRGWSKTHTLRVKQRIKRKVRELCKQR